MSEVRLVVREADRDWSGTIHGGWADRAIAALSADPMTLTELEAACARFAKRTPTHPFFANLSPGLCDEPYDAGIDIIDLVARLVVVESTYSSPESKGEVSYHDGENATDTWLPYHLADDWLLTSDRTWWRAVAEERRRGRTAGPPRDARAVFYGRPLLEFIARETFAAFGRRKTINGSQPADDSQGPDQRTEKDFTYAALKQIHAAWLLTPRHDLGGVCPREVALERHNHLTWDLQDQCERWTLLQKPPPGLDKSSFGFRYGGFGTHELVKYYDLVRELLWYCWERLVELEKTQTADNGPEALTVGDFLTSEVPRLETVRDQWLDTPDQECHGRTPRSIIDRERARLPEGMSGHEAIIDPDCPCCQMLADMPGPMFWNLDGYNMDDDFAFDIYRRPREEWEAEQRRHEEFNKRFEAEQAERLRLGVTESGAGHADEKSVWSSSFTVADSADVPLGIRMFGIGCRLAELITDIRNQPGEPASAIPRQPLIDQLNRDFGNMRELLQTSEPSVAEALIHPVLERFSESLANVASARPDLSPKCESLTSSLAKFLDP